MSETDYIVPEYYYHGSVDLQYPERRERGFPTRNVCDNKCATVRVLLTGFGFRNSGDKMTAIIIIILIIIRIRSVRTKKTKIPSVSIIAYEHKTNSKQNTILTRTEYIDARLISK